MKRRPLVYRVGAAGVLFAAGLSSCREERAAPPQTRPVALPHVLLDTESGPVRVACRPLGSTRTGPAFELLDTNLHPGQGRSGSPLVSPSGEILGGLNATLLLRGRAFGIAPIERIRAALARAQAATVDLVQGLVEIDPLPLSPGDTVLVLRCWGDINLGSGGAVTEVVDGWATFFSHQLAPSPAVVSPVGPCVWLLARGRAVAEVQDDVSGGFEVLMAAGPPIGTCVWNSPSTAAGILGKVPPSTRVSVTYPGWSGLTRAFRVPRQWPVGRTCLGEALPYAFTPLLAFGPGSAHHEIEVEVGLGEGRESVWQVSAGDATGPALASHVVEMVDQGWGEESVLGPAAIDLTIRIVAAE